MESKKDGIACLVLFFALPLVLFGWFFIFQPNWVTRESAKENVAVTRGIDASEISVESKSPSGFSPYGAEFEMVIGNQEYTYKCTGYPFQAVSCVKIDGPRDQ